MLPSRDNAIGSRREGKKGSSDKKKGWSNWKGMEEQKKGEDCFFAAKKNLL